MEEDIKRLEESGEKSLVVYFEGQTLRELGSALALAGSEARLFTRTGLNEKGEPSMWLQVKDMTTKESHTMNESHHCPPEPPQNCLG